MGLILSYELGQTPLDPEQINGLKIKSIATQQQLNEIEQININEALKWLNAKRRINDLLSEKFMVQVHKRMFGMVWNWAGNFRRTETNIGINWVNIPVALRLLLEDTTYWIEHSTYHSDEIALRFKHRLVSIHCFPNGNGRHSRLMADLMAKHLFQQAKFTWGQNSLLLGSDLRKAYLNALQLADKGDYSALLKFARS